MIIKDGRFGAYVTDGELNATLRRGDEIESITPERAAELLAEKRAKGPAPKKRAAKKSPAKKAPAKKAAATTTRQKAAGQEAGGQEGCGERRLAPDTEIAAGSTSWVRASGTRRRSRPRRSRRPTESAPEKSAQPALPAQPTPVGRHLRQPGHAAAGPAVLRSALQRAGAEDGQPGSRAAQPGRARRSQRRATRST